MVHTDTNIIGLFPQEKTITKPDFESKIEVIGVNFILTLHEFLRVSARFGCILGT